MSVNYLAVVVAAVVSIIIGSLWYSPLLFGNVWMRLQRFTKKDMDKAKQKGMVNHTSWHLLEVWSLLLFLVI